MARVIVLDEQEWSKLFDLLGRKGDKEIVIIKKQIAEKYGIEEGTEEIDYDFGEIPDVCIDLIGNEDHYFLIGKNKRLKREG